MRLFGNPYNNDLVIYKVSKDSPDYLDLMAHSYVSELSWIGPLICISREMRDWLVTECTHYFIKSILLSDSINYSHLTAIKAQKNLDLMELAQIARPNIIKYNEFKLLKMYLKIVITYLMMLQPAGS